MARDPLSRQLDELAQRNGAVWGGERQHLELVIAAVGRRDVPVLIDALTDPYVRRHAAQGLGNLGDPAAVVPLLRLLDASDWAVQHVEPRRSLGSLGDPAATARLVEIATQDPEPYPRAAAVEALRQIGDPAVAPALHPLLDDPSRGVQRGAAVTLAELGDPLGVQALRRLRRRPRFAMVSRREPMAPLPYSTRRILYWTWIAAIVVATALFHGRTPLVAQIVIALVLDEVSAPAPGEREAFRRHVYAYDQTRLGFGGWLFAVVLAIGAAAIAHFLYSRSAGLAVLFSIFPLFYRVGVREPDHARDRLAGEPAGVAQPCAASTLPSGWRMRRPFPSTSAVFTSARCVNACGKLPSWRPVRGSYSSASRPTSLRMSRSRSNSSRASSILPCSARTSTSQNEQGRKTPSPPGSPSTPLSSGL